MSIKKPHNFENRIGEVNCNKYGTKMKIIEILDQKNIYIEFQDAYKIIKKGSYHAFKNGTLKNPYDKSVHNIGYLGEGSFQSRKGKDSKILAPYGKWASIIARCYDPTVKRKLPAYEGCTMVDSWHNLQNFGAWYEDNFYQIPGEKMEIDKDILVKGNKIYGPETCVFVPRDMNRLLEKRARGRGKNPIGVSWNPQDKYFEAYCNHKGKRIHHTFHKTEMDAFLSYKNFKESLLKKVAEEYKPHIPAKLYHALINYKVEIGD